MLAAYSDELHNPHKKCLRELLNYMTCFDNDYQRVNIELRNIQKEFKQSIDNVLFNCSELRKLACASEERLNEFQKNVQNIDIITVSFKKRIGDLQNTRDKIIEESKKCFEKLQVEKMRLKQFHQKTINHLKSFAVQTNDSKIIKNCEKDVNELNKQFSKEIVYIKKCESVLYPFIQLLNVSKSQLFHLKEYEWLPQGKSTENFDSVSKEIQDSMGTTLRKAFAHLLIHQPNDKNCYFAQYLMTLVHNEKIMREKIELLQIKN